MSDPVPPPHTSSPLPGQPYTDGEQHAPGTRGPYAQALDAAWLRLQDAVRDQALTPLRDALQQAADIHRSLAEGGVRCRSAGC